MALPKTSLPEVAHPLLSNHRDVWGDAVGYIHTKTYERDHELFFHADAAHSIWLVNDGWVKLTRHTPDGKESIISLCTKGDIFGEAALFPHASYPYNASALSPVSLTLIPTAILRTKVADYPVLSQDIMAVLNARTTQAYLQLEHMTTLSAAQRLGCFLLRLCGSQTAGTAELHIPVEKHVLAAYLGMKPETFSRSQQQLKTATNIEVSGAHIIVHEIRALREYVCGSCSEAGHCEPTANT